MLQSLSRMEKSKMGETCQALLSNKGSRIAVLGAHFSHTKQQLCSWQSEKVSVAQGVALAQDCCHTSVLPAQNRLRMVRSWLGKKKMQTATQAGAGAPEEAFRSQTSFRRRAVACQEQNQ